MTKDYVQALAAVIEAGQKPEVAFANLSQVLERRGHSQLLPRILRTFVREYEYRGHSNTATVTVARESDAKSEIVRDLLKELSITEKPEVVIDETIIGGAKLRSGSIAIDATYKTALINLYQAITK